MRIRVFSFDGLLNTQATGINLELCMLWRVITEAILNRQNKCQVVGSTTSLCGEAL